MNKTLCPVCQTVVPTENERIKPHQRSGFRRTCHGTGKLRQATKTPQDRAASRLRLHFLGPMR